MRRRQFSSAFEFGSLSKVFSHGWRTSKIILASCWTIALFMCINALIYPEPVQAQLTSIIERAAVRAAAKSAKQQAATQSVRQNAVCSTTLSAGKAGSDKIVRRWTSSLCKPSNPCPLDAKLSNTFKGGSYNEVVLGKDTTLYRVYYHPERKLGAPGEPYSFWSRSNATGLQARIDSAIDTSRYGNLADKTVKIRVPEGTRIYEGVTQGIHKGPVGGGNQIIINKVDSKWVIE